MNSSSGNCTLPGEVVEPGTAHDLQPCNQDSYTATKFPFMYSSSGNCTGCQERSWNQVPRMISSPAIRILLNVHCNKNPIYVFLFWDLRALSPSPVIRIFFNVHCNENPIYVFPFWELHAARRGRGTRYRAWSPALQSGFLHCNKIPNYVFLFWELHGLPGEVVEPGTAHDLQPCNQDFFFYVHCNENPIYVFLFWELRAWSPALQSVVVFLCTLQQKSHMCYSSSGNCAHDDLPALQSGFCFFSLMYTATKIPFMYSSSGNCTGCQERSWNQVPGMISSPAIRIFSPRPAIRICF